MEDRSAMLLRGIRRDSKVLELGPSISPMAPRSGGWNVTVVDHASQEELIEKYRNDVHVNVANIERVDHVWRGGALHEAIPRKLHGTYDVLIASHVIEHIPDPIAFFNSAAKLVNPGHGVLALAVPDKRWCFDALKQVSTTGQMLEAHLQRRQRHSAATRFDASAYVVFDGNRTSWGREPLPDLYLPDTLDHAFQEFQAWSADPDAPYVDCHAWHFTPASFQLNILELAACHLCDWHIDWLSPRPTVEFFTQMRPGAETFASPAERDQKRLSLLKQILLEVREQTDWLVDADTSPAVFDKEARQELRQVAAMLRASPLMQEQAGRDWRHMAEAAAMLHSALRPTRAVWRSALPLRRMVARLRGRVR
jgi:hypothetical protein